MTKILSFIFLFALPLFCVEKIHFAGATTIQPIFEDLKSYMEKDLDVNFIIEGGGSQKGMDLLSNGLIDIAMVSRDLKEEEKQKYNFITLAYDGVAIIVNKENSIKGISTNQLRDIYSGKTQNWEQIDSKIKGEIIVVSKMVGRGTLDIFEQYIKLQNPQTINKNYNYTHITKKAWNAGANNDSMVWVGGIKDSIGFVSYGSTKEFEKYELPIKILSLDLIEPTNTTIQNKTYPITRALNLVYKKSNTKVANFIKMLENTKVDEIVEKHYFIRAKHEN